MTHRTLPHGGDWAGFEEEYGRQPLDFSMNVNPLGIPEAVTEAIAKAAQSADRYPDPLCRGLVQKLAEYDEVPREWIFCGNGAADIIFRLARVLKPEFQQMSATNQSGRAQAPTLLITAPTFSEYETAFAENGWRIERFLLQEQNGFRITEAFLDLIQPETTAIFLCEPNNPTGIVTDRGLLQKILDRCRWTGTSLVIDECFNGFLEDPQGHTMKSELGSGIPGAADGGSLIILKAFTKLYGMAGVRLGYCLCSDDEIIRGLRTAGPPWNVSSLAQEAGIAALEETEHVERGLAIVREERTWLKDRLTDLGIGAVFGEANYLLFRSRLGLDTTLRKRGILIRNCGNYHGLEDGWYRIAVRTHEENRQLTDALQEELK